MLNPSSIRRRFGTFLPKAIVGGAAWVLFASCLHFLGGLQSSEVDGITYSLHFPDMRWFVAFSAAVGLVIGAYIRATRWLARADEDEAERSRRFFARVDDYNAECVCVFFRFCLFPR